MTADAEDASTIARSRGGEGINDAKASHRRALHLGVGVRVRVCRRGGHCGGRGPSSEG
jgi:hypothetical protein